MLCQAVTFEEPEVVGPQDCHESRGFVRVAVGAAPRSNGEATVNGFCDALDVTQNSQRVPGKALESTVAQTSPAASQV